MDLACAHPTHKRVGEARRKHPLPSCIWQASLWVASSCLRPFFCKGFSTSQLGLLYLDLIWLAENWLCLAETLALWHQIPWPHPWSECKWFLCFHLVIINAFEREKSNVLIMLRCTVYFCVVLPRRCTISLQVIFNELLQLLGNSRSLNKALQACCTPQPGGYSHAVWRSIFLQQCLLLWDISGCYMLSDYMF